MTRLTYQPLRTSTVQALREGAADAYGLPAERALSNGEGNPCRHCLHEIAYGEGMLIFAHRPFVGLHPYAETGPVFACAVACTAYVGDTPPPILKTSSDYLLKGYTEDERIRYGTGKIVAAADIRGYAADLLQDGDIAFVDVRSARNNCFQLRITRAA